MKPYIELTQNGFFTQISKIEIRSINIAAGGEISEYLDSLQTFTNCWRIIAISGDEVNYVRSANFIAKEKVLNLQLGNSQITVDTKIKYLLNHYIKMV